MHPVIQTQFTTGDPLAFPLIGVWCFLAYGLIEFAFLHRILTRHDFDTLDKILWLLVVVAVPLFGFALYLATAPNAPAPAKPAPRVGNLTGTPWADNPGYTKKSS